MSAGEQVDRDFSSQRSARGTHEKARIARDRSSANHPLTHRCEGTFPDGQGCQVRTALRLSQTTEMREDEF